MNVFDNKLWLSGGIDEDNTKRDIWYSENGIDWFRHFQAVHTITDTYFDLTASSNGNGSISPTSLSVLAGESAEFTLSPDENYVIDSVSGCGGSLSGITYSIDSATSDCTVSASFSLTRYSVSATAGEGGTISPATTQSIEHGSSVDFTVTADDGFEILEVTGCSGTLNETTYTTGSITSDCSVSASFAQVEESPENTPVDNGGDNESSGGGGGAISLWFFSLMLTLLYGLRRKNHLLTA